MPGKGFLQEIFGGLVGQPTSELTPEQTYQSQVTKGLSNTPQLPTSIEGYRADPTGRFGGKDGLETQPIIMDNYSAADLYANTRAMVSAKRYGIPQLTPEQITAFVLKEGRGDMHINDWDRNNPNLRVLNTNLRKEYAPRVAAYLTALKEKDDLAKRKGISFAEAWNGTGVNPNGSSGKDYSRGYQNFLSAASHPKNSGLLSYVRMAAGQN